MVHFTSEELLEIKDYSSKNPYYATYRFIASMAEGREGVSQTSIVWMRGAADVNQNFGEYNWFIRNYTQLQYLTRFGEELNLQRLQDVSNMIASDVIGNILENGVVPSIDQIAIQEAEPAASGIFDGDAAGWAGNPLFLILGHRDALDKNILEDPSDTYDALAMFKFLGSGVSFFESLRLAFDGITGAGNEGIRNGVVALSGYYSTEAFMYDAYGSLSNGAVGAYLSNVTLGRVKLADDLSASSMGGFVHGGGGDDRIFASAASSILDGGADRDIADYSQLNVGIRFALRSLGFSLTDFVGSAIGADGTDTLYSIEEIVGTSGDDSFQLQQIGQSIERLDGGANGDLGDTLTGVYLDGGLDLNTMVGRLTADGQTIDAVGFERLEGSNQADKLTDDGSIKFFNGKAGIDSADYSAATSGFNFYLDGTGPGGAINLIDVEELVVTKYNDVVYGTENDEYLKGEGGDDTLEGKDGADTLDGGKGADTLKGGRGKDTYHVGEGDTIIDDDGEGTVFFDDVKLTGGEVEHEGDECEPGDDNKSDDDKIFQGKQGETYQKTENGLVVTLNDSSITIENWSDGELGIKLEDESPQDGDPCDPSPDELGDPLVLDLDGDGLDLIALENSEAFFDIDSDGIRERTGWVGADDALLVFDRNYNGTIDDATELFANGETYAAPPGFTPDQIEFEGPGGLNIRFDNGFEKLAELDSNEDGKINASDHHFTDLRAWQDTNGDGVSQSSELMGLHEAGVSEISLQSERVLENVEGSLVTDRGTYLDSEGVEREISDVWFRFNQYDSKFDVPDDLDPTLYALPSLGGNGNVKPLTLEMAENISLRGLVEEFASLRATDLIQASVLAEKILYEWVGVASPEHGAGRGLYTDRRATEVFEQFSDTDFKQWSGPNPRPVAGGILSEQVNAILQFVMVRLIAQTTIGEELFPELRFENEAFLILDEGTRSDTVLQRMAESAPEDIFEALAYFQAALRVWDMVYLSFEDVKVAADDGAGYRAEVESILEDSGIQLRYQDIIAARIGGSDKDQFIMPVSSGNQYDNKTPVVVAGEGDDVIVMAGGPQILYWGAGQGDDVVKIDGGTPPLLKIRLPYLTATDIEIVRVGVGFSDDGAIRIIDTGETLVLPALFYQPKNFLEISSSKFTELEFGDGTVINRTEFSELVGLAGEVATDGDDVITQYSNGTVLDGGAGDDFLQGNNSDTIYAFGIGSGHDSIIDSSFSNSTNTVVFGEDIKLADLRLERSGRHFEDLRIWIGNESDSLKIDNQFVLNSSVIDLFMFSNGEEIEASELLALTSLETDGDDIIYGTGGDDQFETHVSASNGGNDIYLGLRGSDTYSFSSGSGQDEIRDSGYDYYSGRNVFREEGIDVVNLDYNFNDLTISYDGSSFVFLDDSTGDQLKVVRSSGEIEQYNFSDVTGLTETDLIALVDLGEAGGVHATVGTTSDDVLDGTAGIDVISGLSGDDTIHGNGSDDVLDGNDGADVITGGAGDDTIDGGQGADTIDGGDGDDIIRAGDRREVSSSDLSDNVLSGGDGEDILYDGWKNDTLNGGAGNDILYGTFGENIIEGGTGNDLIFNTGSGSSDSLRVIYSLGDGDDRVFNSANKFADNVLQFGAGIDQSDLSFSFSRIQGSDHSGYYNFSDDTWALRVDVAQGGSMTLAAEHFGGAVGAGFNYFEFADSSELSVSSILASLRLPSIQDQVIVGESRTSDDILAGGGGNDILIGNSGDQTFLFNSGDGHDTIVNDSPPESNNSVLRLGPGIASDDIVFSRGGEFGESLIIGLVSGDSITILNQFITLQDTGFGGGGLYVDDYIDEIQFLDEPGTVLSAADLRAANNVATNGDDVQSGTADDDIIVASESNDQLIGGMGSDSYSFSYGDGADTIVETAQDFKYRPDESGGDFGGLLLNLSLLRETDTLTFGTGIAIDDLELSVVGTGVVDLRIALVGSTDFLIIENQLAPEANWGRATKGFNDFSFGDLSGSSTSQNADGEPILGPDGEVSQPYWDTFAAGLYGYAPLFQAGIEKFIFADGQEFSREEFAALITKVENSGDNTIRTDNTGGVLDGGAGEDRLEGGSGNDTYILNLGYFNETALDAGGEDTVEFGANISPEVIAFSRVGENGNDLLIEIGGMERNSLLIEGQFSGGAGAIENFVTNDGAVFTAEQIQRMLLSQVSTVSADTIEDYYGNDVIVARESDDRIVLRGGSDLIDGGSGRDTVTFDGERDDFEVATEGDFIIVSDLRGNGDVTRLINVETLEFKIPDTEETTKQEIVANVAPTANQIVFAGREDTIIQLRDTQLLAAASDTEGDGLSLTTVGNPVGGIVRLDSNGQVIFEPDANFSGEASFSYTVVDAEGLDASASVIVNISAVNDAPTVANLLLDQSSDEDTALSFAIPANTFSDVDGDMMSLSATLADGSELPTWLAFDGDIGAFSGTPPQNYYGAVNVTVKASDGILEASDTFVLDITSVNDAPVIENTLSDQAIAENMAFSFSVPIDSFFDTDGDLLIFSAALADGSTLPAWLAFDDDTRTFSGIPPQDFNGSLDVSVTASDGSLEASDTFTLDITSVNDAPVVANSLTDQSSDEDVALLFTIPADTFSDADGDALNLSAALADGSTLPAWLAFDEDTRTFSGTPPQDFNGSLDVSVTASDGSLEASDTFTLDITSVNDAPVVANSLTDQTSDEDVALLFTIPADTFSDADGDALNLSAVLADGSTLPTWLAFDEDTRTFSGIPPQDFNGSLDVSVTASDGSLEASDTFTLDITSVNDAPVANDDGNIEATNGEALTILASDLLANDTDVDGDSLTISSVHSNSGNGTVELNTDGNVIYVASEGFVGDDSFEYTISDSELTSTTSVRVTVDGDSDPYEGWTKGTDGRDHLFGNWFDNNQIYGGGGNDKIYGGFRADQLDGGSGNDRIYGGWGNDTINGGSGNDRIHGGAGRDTISGGEGNDRLWGGAGQDNFVFSTGSGKDRIMDYDTGRNWGWFQSGGDTISIDIEGINSFADLMANASQQRGSVVFDFGNGDELILSHTRLAALDRDAFTFF